MTPSKKKHEEHENHERWLVSYADFITLLFAFFVVMYATSNNNLEKQKKFEESVREQLKLGGTTSGGASSAAKHQVIGEIIEPIDLLSQKGIGNRELEDYVQRVVDKNFGQDEIKKTINEIKHDSIGVRISLAASTLFPVGSAKLRGTSLKTIDKIAYLLRRSNRRVIVEGHTDDQPIGGGIFESNWELAAARATQLVRYLIKVHNLDPQLLAAISYGEYKPISNNDTEENRSKNRRVEILIVNSDD